MRTTFPKGAEPALGNSASSTLEILCVHTKVMVGLLCNPWVRSCVRALVVPRAVCYSRAHEVRVCAIRNQCLVRTRVVLLSTRPNGVYDFPDKP